MYRILSFSLALVLVTLSYTAGVNSQTMRASVSGRVIFKNGSVVSGATVKVWQQVGSLEVMSETDEKGHFHFKDLADGRYSVRVSLEGFSSSEQEVILSVGEERKVEFVVQSEAASDSIVVNSTHIIGTPEASKTIPGSVEIIDQKTMERNRPFTFSDILRKVTGVNVRDEEGFGLRPNIGIRGLNPTRSTRVLLLEDGVPLAFAPYGDNSSYYHPPINRFESVEVLKGSGQILYGPRTIGGVINYITPNPPKKSGGFVTLMGGSRDFFNGRINYGGTWRGVGLLFDYMRKQGEGARDNIRVGLDDFNFKSSIGIGETQILTVKANYYGEDSNLTYSGLREAEYLTNPRQNPFRNDFFYGDRFGASASHIYILDSAKSLTTNFYGSFFKRHWWRQASNSNERPNDAADPACGGMANLNTTCGNQGRLRQYYVWGLEPRLQASHKIFGVKSEADIGFRAHFEIQDRMQQNGPKPDSRSGVVVEDNERRNQAYSSFLQNRFLVSNWIIIAGVRLEHVKYERTNRLASGGAGVTGKTSLTQVIPGIGISYRPKSNLAFYGGIHRGFAPPRTEDIINNAGGSLDLESELSWNYEAGIRTSPYRGISLEASFFRIDYENQIVPATVASGVGTTLVNGGKTLHQGAELSAQVNTDAFFSSPHHFYVRTAYTYLPTVRFNGVLFQQVTGVGAVNIDGNRLPYAPKNLLNFEVGYYGKSGIDALLEAVHVSDQFSDDRNTVVPTPDGQRGLIPGYTIWNATANYNVEKIRSTFFVTVKNLLDKTFIVDRSRGVLPGSPRIVQGGIKYRF